VRRAALLLLALVALSACGGGGSDRSQASAAPVVDLANVLKLRADFEADAGKTRVLLLFSPT